MSHGISTFRKYREMGQEAKRLGKPIDACPKYDLTMTQAAFWRIGWEETDGPE